MTENTKITVPSNLIAAPISSEDVGKRLDQVLSKHPQIGSRTFAHKLIHSGHVFINQTLITKPATLIQKNDHIEFTLPHKESSPSSIIPKNLPIDIIFEDDFILVINKPAGLVVHPSLGHKEDSLVHRLIGKFNLSQGSHPERPGIVHRLDKETSGLLVVAKNDESHRFLSLQFQKKTAYRIYEAICWRIFKTKKSTICSYLSRHPYYRQKWASIRNNQRQIIRHPVPHPSKGKWSITHYEIIKENPIYQCSLVQLKLETGRTHQIRVHLSEWGHPILGDVTYGYELKKLPQEVQSIITNLPPNRILLHGKELGFIHPQTKKLVTFKVSWPLEDQLYISKLFDRF